VRGSALIYLNVHSTVLNKIQEARPDGRKPRRRLVPRYFFTIRGWDRVKDDPHGTNLPDIAAALSNAERKIRELRKESGYNNDPTLMMIVKDEAGHTVLSLPFFPGY
jgi:hypothetical protein